MQVHAAATDISMGIAKAFLLVRPMQQRTQGSGVTRSLPFTSLARGVVFRRSEASTVTEAC